MERTPGSQDRGLIAFSQRIVWPLGALVLTLVLLQLSPLPLKHVFIVLFTSILLAAAVAPPAHYLARYRVPRPLTILLIYLVVLAVLIGIVALLVPVVVNEVNGLQESLPQYADELQRQIARVAPAQAGKLSAAGAANELSSRLAGFAGTLTSIIFSFFSAGITVVLILVMAFFMADEENFATRTIRRLVPPTYQLRTLALMGRIGTRLGQWARAQLLLAAFFGVAFGIGLRIMGMHYAVTLGAVGAVLEIIPYVGGFITVALAMLLALTQHPFLAIPVVVWYIVVVELEGHVLAPILMDRMLGIHPLIIVIALFLGGEALGILGALLAVPIAIVIQSLLDEFYRFSVPKRTEIVSPTAMAQELLPLTEQRPPNVPARLS
jgi:predicted PurR-regulated permease PerM